MMTRKLVAMIMALSVCMLASAPAWAQKNNRNNQDEKRENQRVAEAQKEVREQQAHVSAAEQQLRSLMKSSVGLGAKLAAARSQLRETRERVADEMAQAMGIEAALTRLKDAKAQLAAHSQPVLDKLHQTVPWHDAKQAADAAKVEAQKVREDILLADDQRSAKLDELTRLILRPNELERQTVLNSSEGPRLTGAVTAASAAIEKIRQAIPDSKVESAPAVVQAKKAVEKAEQEVKKQLQSVNAERGSIQKAQQRLVQSRQKLQQAQAADARDKNRK